MLDTYGRDIDSMTFGEAFDAIRHKHPDPDEHESPPALLLD